MDPCTANPAVALPGRGFFPAFRLLLTRLRQWLASRAQALHRTPRRLQLCETVSLGERRFVAVIRCESQQFLIGATASSIALIARLDDRPPEPPTGDGELS